MERERAISGVYRSRCWVLMRKLNVFTVAQLVEGGITRAAAKWMVGRLVAAGVVRKINGNTFDPHSPGTYRLERDLGRRCPVMSRSGRLSTTPTCRERLWGAMKPLRGGWTVAELAGLARCREQTASIYVTALVRAGILKEQGKDGGRRSYRLPPDADTGPEPPLVLKSGKVYDQNTDQFHEARAGSRSRLALWNAMRSMPDWTVRELSDAHGASPGFVGQLVRALEAAGLAERLTPHRVNTRYRLAPGADTGPLAPAIARDGTVTDRNTGRVHRPKWAA